MIARWSTSFRKIIGERGQGVLGLVCLCVWAFIGGFPSDGQADGKVVLKMQAQLPTSFPVIGSSIRYFADQVNQRTDTVQVKIYEPGKLVGPMEVLPAVSDGRIDAGWGFYSYLEAKIKGITLLLSPPFSASAEKHYRWLSERSGRKRLLKAFQDAGYHVMVIPAVISSAEGFGWFAKPVQRVNDLKGMKLRYTGYGAKILANLGATPVMLPGGEIYIASERGVIDGFKYSTPYVDKKQKFYQIAKYYYYPSCFQPFTITPLLINRSTWNRMTTVQQKLIEDVCADTIHWGLKEDKRLTEEALTFFKAQGVTVSPLRQEILDAAKLAWETYAKKLGDENSEFKKNYLSYLAFFDEDNEGKRQPPEKQEPHYDLEPIDEEYVALKKANIRQSASVESHKIKQLAKGETITALGRVRGKSWILVARDGEKLGYVYEKLIGPKETYRGYVDPDFTPETPNHTYPDQPVAGTYHALLIGIENYQHLPPLSSPIEDVTAIGNLLEEKYGFIVDRPLLLDATREEILRKFGVFREKLTKDDNLLIYYAGHGTIDQTTKRGYWQPVNADKSNPANWIANEDIRNALVAMHARHIIVVADSCYSGTITRSYGPLKYKDGGKEEWIRRMIKLKSRTALTSGGTEPVIDNGGGENSVFAKYLLQALRENEQIIDMDSLFPSIRERVVWNARQTPIYETIQFAGHDGGDFILVPQ